MEDSRDTTLVGVADSGKSKKTFEKDATPLYYTLLVLSLLSTPFLMGLHINALGNAEPIKYRIAVQNKLDEGSTNYSYVALKVPNDWWSIGCLYPLGGLVGALAANPLMSMLGRRYSSYIFLLSSLIGGILKLASYWGHFAILMVGRFFDGIGSAGLMVTVVVLIFELISKFGAKIAKPMIQISVNFGILLIAVTVIGEGFGLQYQYSFIISIVLTLYIFFAIFILPESPVWLYENHKQDEAIKVLKKVHAESYEAYFDEIKERFAKSTDSNEKIGYRELFGRRYRGAIISTILLNAAQQLSGINCIMAFAPTILSQMGIGRPDLFSLIITSSAFLGSVIFAPIVSLRQRKRLLIIGHSLMSICLIAQLLTYHLNGPGAISIVVFSLFVFIFQIAPGPLVWFICIEIFPPDAVSAAQSLGVAANWISNAIVFGIAGLSQDIMILFCIVNILISIYLYFFVAETLNRTPNDILDEYEQRFSACSC